MLLEDVPGTAKTVLARAMARSIEGATAIAHPVHARPAADGRHRALAIFDQKEREFEFRPGPIFANVVLVDEINRAMPKTQSALLEAMAEQQVTVDGVTRLLPAPVPAARDGEPDRVRGHVPAPRGAARPLLPEAPRWATRRRTTSCRSSTSSGTATPLEHLGPVVGLEEILELRGRASETSTSTRLSSAGSSISSARRASRGRLDGRVGARERSRSSVRVARVGASARPVYVVPEDVERLVRLPCVAHRLVFRRRLPRGGARGGGTPRSRMLRRRCLELAPRPQLRGLPRSSACPSTACRAVEQP